MHDQPLVAPGGSLYFWCYTQGLKHVPLDAVQAAALATGRVLRDKDVENYWNGWYRSNNYGQNSKHDMFVLKHCKEKKPFVTTPLSAYPNNPLWNQPEISERWVPCSATNKPMKKWSNGCMSKEDAEAYSHQVYLAENIKGTSFVIIDCDGDHDEKLDLELIRFLYPMTNITHTLFKPKLITSYEGYEDSGLNMPASFHLTFVTNKIIPTMHFPECHIDIIGNEKNSLRYWKNKIWNGMSPKVLTNDIWTKLQEYVKGKE